MAIYKLFVPPQAVGANLVYFDLFNTGSNGVDVRVISVFPNVQNSAAVVGTLGVDVYLTRTSAVGTGGTAATYEGSSLSAATICALDSSQPANVGQVSARLTPSGGATAGPVLAFRSLSTEETSSGSYQPVFDMVGGLSPSITGMLIPAGSGIRVVQGSVASVGNVGFEVFFSITSR